MLDFFLADFAAESVDCSIDQQPLLFDSILAIVVETDEYRPGATRGTAHLLVLILVILLEAEAVEQFYLIGLDAASIAPSG